MAPGQRPHQPNFHRTGQSPTDPSVSDPSPDDAAEVQVNDGSKVSDLDPERFEEVPAGGGRFSAWRRHVQVENPTTDAADGAQRTPPLTPAQRRSRRRRRALWAAITAVVAALVLVWVIFFSPLLAVRAIEVNGAQLTDEQDVQQHLEHFQGTPMAQISESDVMDSLGDLPQVRSVHVMTMPDRRLIVDLTERVAVAAVQDGQSWSLVDHEGTVLRTTEDLAELNVPVIEGGTEVLGTEDFTSVADVLSTLPSSLLEQVSSAKAQSDSTVELELNGGITVKWGDATQSALKAEVLAQLIQAPEQTGAVNVYDVSTPEHPVLS